MNKRVWSITVVQYPVETWLHCETWMDDGHDPLCAKGFVDSLWAIELLEEFIAAAAELTPCVAEVRELDQVPY